MDRPSLAERTGIGGGSIRRRLALDQPGRRGPPRNVRVSMGAPSGRSGSERATCLAAYAASVH